MIEKYLQNGSSIVTVDESGGRCVLSGKKFEEEYGIHAFGKLEENVEKMAAYMKKHASVFVDERELSLPWWKRMLNQWMWLVKAIIPFIENLICFIPFFMLNNRTVGSEYFANLDPYLLYVLLFAIVYGQQQATFSAICAVAGYMFRQMYTRSGFEVLVDYFKKHPVLESGTPSTTANSFFTNIEMQKIVDKLNASYNFYVDTLLIKFKSELKQQKSDAFSIYIIDDLKREVDASFNMFSSNYNSVIAQNIPKKILEKYSQQD